MVIHHFLMMTNVQSIWAGFVYILLLLNTSMARWSVSVAFLPVSDVGPGNRRHILINEWYLYGHKHHQSTNIVYVVGVRYRSRQKHTGPFFWNSVITHVSHNMADVTHMINPNKWRSLATQLQFHYDFFCRMNSLTKKWSLVFIFGQN